MSDGYVYVLGFSNGTVKVGRTQNLSKRMTIHRTSARHFGFSITQSWNSPLHAEWLANENALKLIATDLGGKPVTAEYFEEVGYAALVERATQLPFTTPPPVVTAPKQVAYLRVRFAQLKQHAEAAGFRSESDLATYTGLDRSTLNRLLRGLIAPGPQIICGILGAFPDREFEDFFEAALRDKPEPARRWAA